MSIENCIEISAIIFFNTIMKTNIIYSDCGCIKNNITGVLYRISNWVHNMYSEQKRMKFVVGSVASYHGVVGLVPIK